MTKSTFQVRIKPEIFCQLKAWTRTEKLGPTYNSVRYWCKRKMQKENPNNLSYPYHYKKGVPYFLAKIEAYHAYVMYCHSWSKD